jgi:hypothetical protein
VTIGGWRQLQALRRGEQVRRRIVCTNPLAVDCAKQRYAVCPEDAVQQWATARERPLGRINKEDEVRGL